MQNIAAANIKRKDRVEKKAKHLQLTLKFLLLQTFLLVNSFPRIFMQTKGVLVQPEQV